MIRMTVWMLAAFLAIGTVTPGAVGQDEEQPRPRRRMGRPEVEDSQPRPKPEEAKEKKKEKKDDVFLAIRGGDVYTVTSGVLEGATILVKNGKIHEIGRDVRVPEKAEVIEAAGMRIYPGLIALNSSGILGRDPVQDNTDPFDFSMVLALATGITTAVTGNTAAKLTYGSLDDMTIKENLFIPLSYTTRNPGGRRSLRQDLDRVRNYLRDLREYEIKKKEGEKDLEEPDKKWLTGKYENYRKLLTGEATAKFSADDAQSMREICALVETYGFRAVIDGGAEAWTIASELGRAGVKLLFSPRDARSEDLRTNRLSGSSIDASRILHDHGVPFAIQAPSGGISLGGIIGRDLLTLPLDAAFAVRGGLPDDAAVETITIGAARVLGIDDRVGSIEPGKDADLIVCDGDLLHYNTMVQWTIVNGKIVYDKEKESVFRHIRPRPGKEAEALPTDYWPRRWIEEFIRGESR